MKKKLLITFLYFYFLAAIFGQDFSEIFNSSISEVEIQQLQRGETLIRNIGNVKKVTLTESDNQYMKILLEELRSRKPNYLAEIIKILPKKNNSTIQNKISDAILDIESYTKIPYFSVRNQKWYDLYDSAVVNSILQVGNNVNISYTVVMVPFGTIDFRGKIQKTQNSLYFTMINDSKVIFEEKKITCIRPEKMLCAIVLFEYKDYYVLYGVGAIEAPSIFFLKDRIETAFIGRIKDFCKYMFEQINIR